MPRGRPKGGKKVGGRKKGTPNKFTGTLRQMVMEALDRRGAVAFLAEELSADQFLQLLLKILPQEVATSGLSPTPTTPEQIFAALANDHARYAAVIGGSGISAPPVGAPPRDHSAGVDAASAGSTVQAERPIVSPLDDPGSTSAR